MTWLLPPLRPTFEAALRDVGARGAQARVAAAERLGAAEPERASQALAGLIALAGDREAPVRGAALRGLKELADPAAVDCLLSRIDDDDALVRELAVVALGVIEHTRAHNALRRALRSQHPEVRFQAAASLAESKLHEPADAGAIAALLRDSDPKVRANAARSLADAAATVQDELRGALSDPEPLVRAEAALALSRHGDGSGAAALRDALDHPELVIEALDAIGSLGLVRLADRVADIAESVLKPLVVKTAAARALIRLQDPRGVPALRDVLRAFRSDARSYAVHIVGELRVDALAGELLRLSRRPRGADPEALVDALQALLPGNEQARAGLERMARRGDAAGDRARRMLDQVT